MSEGSQDEFQDGDQTELCDRLTSALNFMAAGLKSFIEDTLKKQYREAWEDNISRIKGHLPKLEDPYVLLTTIDDRWVSAFNGKLNVNQSDIKELRTTRNEVIHHDPSVPFTPDSVNISIRKMLRLLKNVPASQRKKNTVEKLERLIYRAPGSELETVPRNVETEANSLNEADNASKAGKAENINAGAVVQVREIMTELKADDAPPPVQREEPESVHQEAQLAEPGHTVGANQDEPTVTYNYSRLCFKASSIEPLEADQIFRVVTPEGTFQMTKAEFYRAFPKVVVSKSYKDSKIYHYPSVPRSALPYKLPK